MGRVQLDGLALEVHDEGLGPPALLLHGFPTTKRLWDGTIPHLCSAGFRCIAPDLAGYGLSESPADGEARMERQARWLVELLDALQVDSALVVAHDVGSAQARSCPPKHPGGFAVWSSSTVSTRTGGRWSGSRASVIGSRE